MICALFGRKGAFVLVPCLAELTQRRLPKYFLWRAPSAHFDWFQGPVCIYFLWEGGWESRGFRGNGGGGEETIEN